MRAGGCGQAVASSTEAVGGYAWAVAGGRVRAKRWRAAAVLKGSLVAERILTGMRANRAGRPVMVEIAPKQPSKILVSTITGGQSVGAGCRNLDLHDYGAPLHSG